MFLFLIEFKIQTLKCAQIRFQVWGWCFQPQVMPVLHVYVLPESHRHRRKMAWRRWAEPVCMWRNTRRPRWRVVPGTGPVTNCDWDNTSLSIFSFYRELGLSGRSVVGWDKVWLELRWRHIKLVFYYEFVKWIFWAYSFNLVHPVPSFLSLRRSRFKTLAWKVTLIFISSCFVLCSFELIWRIATVKKKFFSSFFFYFYVVRMKTFIMNGFSFMNTIINKNQF